MFVCEDITCLKIITRIKKITRKLRVHTLWVGEAFLGYSSITKPKKYKANSLVVIKSFLFWTGRALLLPGLLLLQFLFWVANRGQGSGSLLGLVPWRTLLLGGCYSAVVARLSPPQRRNTLSLSFFGLLLFRRLLNLNSIIVECFGEEVYSVVQGSHLSCILLSLLATKFDCVLFGRIQLRVGLH